MSFVHVYSATIQTGGGGRRGAGKGRESEREKERGGGSGDTVTCRRTHMVLQQRIPDHQDSQTPNTLAHVFFPNTTPPPVVLFYFRILAPAAQCWGRTWAGKAAPWLGRTETPPAEGKRGKNKSTTLRRFLILKKSSAREYTRFLSEFTSLV